MKEGTKVKVLTNVTEHGFRDGEIVGRRVGEYDNYEDSLGFYSEVAGLWYMTSDEYKIVDKSHTVALLADVYNLAMSQGLSREVLETIAHAVEMIEEDMESEQ
jgi:hypothetical protein